MNEVERYHAAVIVAIDGLAAIKHHGEAPAAIKNAVDLVLASINRMVNPRDETEDVTIERWGYETSGGYTARWLTEAEAVADNPDREIKRFSATFPRAKPTPVVRSVKCWISSTEATILCHNAADLADIFGKHGTFTWVK